MPYQRKKPIISSIESVRIMCGACGKTSAHTGGLDIEAGHCSCDPDTYTCMCWTGKRLNFQCPLEDCKFSGTIELY